MILIDNPRLTESKTGRFVTFSVYFQEADKSAVFEGFRVGNGYIAPPAIRSKGGYTNAITLCDVVAVELYDMVKASGWVEVFQLKPLDPPEKALKYVTIVGPELQYRFAAAKQRLHE